MMKRRDFFSRALAGLAALPFLTTEAVAKACKVGAAPAGKKVVKEEGKAAKRLKYVADATKSTHKKYKPGAACLSCKFYKKKKEEGGYAPCSMLGNKYVSGCGWCKSYRKA